MFCTLFFFYVRFLKKKEVWRAARKNNEARHEPSAGSV
jgi:hypothetical protein